MFLLLLTVVLFVLAVPSGSPRVTGPFLGARQSGGQNLRSHMGEIAWTCELLGQLSKDANFRYLVSIRGDDEAYEAELAEWISSGGPTTALQAWETLNRLDYLPDPEFDWQTFLGPRKIELHYSRSQNKPATGCPTCVTSDLGLPVQLHGYCTVETSARQALTLF